MTAGLGLRALVPYQRISNSPGLCHRELLPAFGSARVRRIGHERGRWRDHQEDRDIQEIMIGRRGTQCLPTGG